ncbi:MAG: hypothetical protein FWF61_05330 [Brevinematales bacterium]|nr:hypothetical protein [Brevinematales bacterium]
MSENKKQEANEKLAIIRHSAAHIMAQAVVKLFSGTKTAIGPCIENGFYYDFLLPRPITADDLVAVEDEMKKIIDSRQDFIRITVSRKDATGAFP